MRNFVLAAGTALAITVGVIACDNGKISVDQAKLAAVIAQGLNCYNYAQSLVTNKNLTQECRDALQPTVTTCQNALRAAQDLKVK